MHKCDRCETQLPWVVKEYCPDCRQKLNEEDEDPKLRGLKDQLERAKTQERRLFAERQHAIREHDESCVYVAKCLRELQDYKKEAEHRQSASYAAAFLEKEAKWLRDHPETFEDAKWQQNYPAAVKEQRDGCFVGHTVERNDPLTTTIKITTWPQRKVSKEGEEK